jgi:hypothetical protein
MRRKATFIVYAAAGIGLLLIAGATVSRRIRLERLERQCQAGDLGACEDYCRQGAQDACARLEQQCRSGAQQACQMHERAQSFRRR